MEPARSVKDRWTVRAPTWGPVLPPLPNTVVPGWVGKNLLPGTEDEDLPELSRVAAHGERTFWHGLLGIWRTVADRADEAALLDAIRRGSVLDLDRHLLPDLDRHLLRQFLEPRLHTMFRHGIDVTAGHLREQGVAVKALSASLEQPYREAAAWARQHSGELVTAISERQREAIARLIARANREGLDPDEVARRVRRIVGLRPDQVDAANAFRDRLRRSGVSARDANRRTREYSGALQRQRARLIARSELIRSVNAGQHALWTEAVRSGAMPRGMRKRWIVTEDERLCPRCEALGAREPIPLGAEFAPGVLFPGLHPNCVTGRTRVWSDAAVGASRRWFDGEVVVIRVAGGQELVCTPQHPILTPMGWMAAGLLDEGGYVVGDGRRQWGILGDTDHEDMPPRIEEMAQAALGPFQMPSGPVPVAPEDFHGDGGGSKVAVVWSDSLLRDSRHAALMEEGGEPGFKKSRGECLAGAGAAAEAVERVALSPAELVGSRNLSSASLGTHSTPLQGLSLRPSPNGETLLSEAETDDVAADAELARQLLDGCAGPITLQQIVNVERQAFHGFVYNLETARGWYAAEGIITHNCRCAMELVPPPVTALPALLLPEASMAEAVERLPFDPVMREVAEVSGRYWRQVERTFGDLDVATLTAAQREEVVRRGVDMLAKSVVHVSVPIRPYAGRSAWWAARLHEGGIEFSDRVSDVLLTLFTHADPQKWAQTTSVAYNGLRTATHELLHAKSLAHPWFSGLYHTIHEQFIEEGLIDLRARHIAASLTYHGTSVSLRRAAAQRLQAAFGRHPYDPFVAQMSWYERSFGATATDRLFGQTFGVRIATAADELRGYVSDYAHRRYPRVAAQVDELLSRATDDQMVDAWMRGQWKAMGQMPATSDTAYVYGLWDALRLGR